MTFFHHGKYFLLDTVEGPKTEKCFAPGKRVDWKPGLNYVALTKGGRILSTGDPVVLPENTEWVESCPEGYSDFPITGAPLILLSSPPSKWVYSGSVARGNFLSPSHFCLPEDRVTFVFRDEIPSKFPNRKSEDGKYHDALITEGVLDLLVRGRIGLWKNNMYDRTVSTVCPTSELTEHEWAVLGYRYFGEKFPMANFNLRGGRSRNGVTIPSHDLPAIEKVFPGSEMTDSESDGTHWAELNVASPAAAKAYFPWMARFAGRFRAKWCHQYSSESRDLVWVGADAVPAVKKCGGEVKVALDGDDKLSVGFDPAKTVFDRSSCSHLFASPAHLKAQAQKVRSYSYYATREVIFVDTPDALVPRDVALASYKSYTLDKLTPVEKFVTIEKGGGLTIHKGEFYPDSALQELPLATQSAKKNKRYYQDKFGDEAVPSDFWRYSEEEIAEASGLLEKVGAGELIEFEVEGCIPPEAVTSLTGSEPVYSKILGRRFVPKITIPEFFANPKWVKNLVTEMHGSSYKWLLDAALRGDLDLRKAVVQSVF